MSNGNDQLADLTIKDVVDAWRGMRSQYGLFTGAEEYVDSEAPVASERWTLETADGSVSFDKSEDLIQYIQNTITDGYSIETPAAMYIDKATKAVSEDQSVSEPVDFLADAMDTAASLYQTSDTVSQKRMVDDFISYLM